MKFDNGDFLCAEIIGFFLIRILRIHFAVAKKKELMAWEDVIFQKFLLGSFSSHQIYLYSQRSMYMYEVCNQLSRIQFNELHHITILCCVFIPAAKQMLVFTIEN